MASTGWTIAGAGANNADAGTVAWDNANFVTADDATNFASSSTSRNQTTQYLHATTFGFAIPAGTIDGIEVRIDRSCLAASICKDHTLQLIKGGVRTGDNNAATATDWPTYPTFSNADYGGAADGWAASLTPTDVNASTFGVALRAAIDDEAAATPWPLVDAIWINVHYTASGANTAPVADAGPDQNVLTGATVTLDGSGSSDVDDDPLTYAWTLPTVPSGSTAVLSDATAVGPTFTADLDGTYIASLVVNDGTVDSAADTVTVTASAEIKSTGTTTTKRVTAVVLPGTTKRVTTALTADTTKRVTTPLTADTTKRVTMAPAAGTTKRVTTGATASATKRVTGL